LQKLYEHPLLIKNIKRIQSCFIYFVMEFILALYMYLIFWNNVILFLLCYEPK